MAPFIRGPTQAQVMAQNNDDRNVRLALSSMEAAAQNVTTWKTQDPAVRQAYIALIKFRSDWIWKMYKSGKMSAREAAAGANDSRNFIMNVTRLMSTPEGRRAANKLKLAGASLDSLTNRYAMQDLGKPFTALNEAEQTQVYETIIQSAGRSRQGVNIVMQSLGASTRVFWVLTLLMGVYDISSARDKVKATVRVLEVSAGAFIAGEILGGLIGTFAGPEGTSAGFVIGGVISAWAVNRFAFGDGDPTLMSAR
jgi:hypothetical protein